MTTQLFYDEHALDNSRVAYEIFKGEIFKFDFDHEDFLFYESGS